MFSVGDKIRIKRNLDKLRFKNDPGVTREMLDCEGMEDTIRYVSGFYHNPENFYLLENNDWTWAESWLEPVVMYNIKEIEDTELENMFK